jgi:hypothetical protein
MSRGPLKKLQRAREISQEERKRRKKIKIDTEEKRKRM